MLRITSVKPLDNYSLWLRFNNGDEGVADLSAIPRDGVFEAWNDPAFFRKVAVDANTGTVVWPGELDLDPYVLLSRATGRTIEEALRAI